MYSIKGGWVGQTFALAKPNESEGRKTRIRLSKEERKAMVESFIKKYQESNNGNFPSLNLTHKEVGGSFYTVREIVRDIIQENRVLGPAKFNLQELTSDKFFECNPLGSIARDPQSYLAASSNENHHEPNSKNLLDTSGKKLSVSDGHNTETEHDVVDKGHVVNASQEDVVNEESIEAPVVSDGYYKVAEHPVIDKGHIINGNQVVMTKKESIEAPVVSDGYYTGAEDQNVDRGHFVYGSQVDVINKESSEATFSETQVSEPMASKQNVGQELATATTPIAKVSPVTADLVVETFPLRPDVIEEGLGESRDLSISPEKDVNMLESALGKESFELNSIEPTKTTSLLDEKFENGFENQILKNNNKTGQDEEKNLGDVSAESAKDSTQKELYGHEIEDSAEPQVGVSHHNTITFETGQMIDGTKTNIQDDFPAKNLTKTYISEGSKPSEEGLLQKANKHRVDSQLGDNSPRSSTTLDRINLESWDGTHKNSSKQESNPLVAIFKAFVDAFMKFWSE